MSLYHLLSSTMSCTLLLGSYPSSSYDSPPPSRRELFTCKPLDALGNLTFTLASFSHFISLALYQLAPAASPRHTTPSLAGFTGSAQYAWNGNLTGPKRVDGITPDMRYNVNRTPRSATSSGFTGSATRAYNGNPSGPLTKSGRPDMRYKANWG